MNRWLLVAAMLVSLGGGAERLAADEPQSSAKKIRFKRHHLDDTFRSEGVAVGDFSNNGQLDIAAGGVYFRAPDWTLVPMIEPVPEHPQKGYSRSFNNFTADMNGNGRDDLIVVAFPGQETYWLENPGSDGDGGPWAKHVMLTETNNESPQFVDLTGDGKREFVFGTTGNVAAYATPGDTPYEPWKVHTISTPEAVEARRAPRIHRFYHGLGVGDINGNGRNDIITPEGWFEHPQDRSRAEWTFHRAPLGQACADMHAIDLNGSGRADVLSSSAHNYGIWWHEQTAEGWKTHTIDRTFSQTHSLCVADINGNGKLDFVTGKRYWAHNGNDPGADEPVVLYWFEYELTDDGPKWTPHLVDRDSGVGTQFVVVDVNGDGLLDIVTSNKKGTFYFEQVRE